MSNLLYLFLAFVLSGIGWLILWLRHRQPTSVEYGIEEFNRELRALAPDRQQPPPPTPDSWRDRTG
ncbi:MAG: hypothetical protein H0W70_08340 [Actinobacteria bacterium]|nr:hypothetical protein [Actinomycetota bacterium]